jgi:hypothetical protein
MNFGLRIDDVKYEIYCCGSVEIPKNRGSFIIDGHVKTIFYK